MIAEHKVVLEEILQMKLQYQKEISGPRKAWPRSIRERVTALDVAGVHAKVIADKVGIPYDTILQWRYQRNSDLKKSFREVAVVEKSKLTSSGTVTVPESQTKKIAYSGTVTVTTPDGYTILVQSAECALLLIQSLRSGAKCS